MCGYTCIITCTCADSADSAKDAYGHGLQLYYVEAGSSCRLQCSMCMYGIQNAITMDTCTIACTIARDQSVRNYASWIFTIDL